MVERNLNHLTGHDHPLLVEHGRDDTVTSDSVSSAGHSDDSGRSRDARSAHRGLTQYTFGTP
jgi:hypothetical protein